MLWLSPGHVSSISLVASAIVANGCAPKSCDIPIIKVKNTRKTMSKLVANFYNHPSEKLNTC